MSPTARTSATRAGGENQLRTPTASGRAQGSMLSSGSPTLDGFLRRETGRRINRLPLRGLSGIRALGAGDWWDSQFSGGSSD
jgi:hypothetical protein